MRCPKCQYDNPSSMRFCGKCRTVLALNCPKCSFKNPPEFDFCGQCAADLRGPTAAPKLDIAAPTTAATKVIFADPAPSAPEGERKTVTALFADISGSTAMMEDLDPERARAVVDPALRLMIDASRRYDGHIVQSTGDGIFALFGAPIAQEDHPQRALYAALRMQEELRRYSAKLVTDGGNPLHCRVGINTGEVVIRSIATRDGHTEYAPIGHVINLASRMQAVAPVGSVAVAESTARLCEGYFTLRSLGPVGVKGLTEPVHASEVTGLGPLRSRLQRAAGRGLAKFVGRDREMDLLEHSLRLAFEGRGQVATVVAEAGTGKSRLFFEFKLKNQAGWTVLEGFSVAHGKASGYLPVIELLRNYFKIGSEDDEATRRDKVTARLTALDLPLEDTLPFLLALLGIAAQDEPAVAIDPQIKKRRTLEVIKRILLRESLQQPLMLVFEDLQWIDEETQAVLDMLADSIGTARIILLVNYRPEYHQEWSNKTYYTQLRLDPLRGESAEEMLSVLVGDGFELLPLKRLIIERTEGNPFFIEETVQVLFEEAALVRTGATVRLTKPANELRIPATVQSILAARIDRLPPREKNLLQTLAVVGREFSLPLIAHVLQKESSEELLAMLTNLQLAEFIYEQPSVGDIQYTFKHALTQDVAYGSLLIERRKLLHQRAGLALETLFADQLEDYLSDLANHYSRSGHNAKAVEYLAKAAKREISQNAYRGALRHLKSAIELVPGLEKAEERDRRELDLLIDYGVTLLVLEGWYVPDLGGAYQRALELCKQLGEEQHRLSVLFGIGSFHACRGNLRQALAHAEEMDSLDSASPRDKTLLSGWLMGNAQFFMGDFAAAHASFERAISSYDKTTQRSLAFRVGQDLCVTCLAYDAMIWLILGFPDQAEKKLEEALALARDLGYPFTLAVCLTTAANYYCIRRDFRRVPALVQETEALSREHGFGFYAEIITSFEMLALASEGRVEELMTMASRVSKVTDTGLEEALSWFRSALGEAFGNLGRAKAGFRLVEQATEIMNKNDEHYAEAEIYRIRGVLTLKKLHGRDSTALELQASRAEAERAFRDAMEIARRQGAKLFELRAATCLSQLLIDAGRSDEAGPLLDEIYGRFTEGFDAPDLRAARALLDTLRPLA